jgi:hypothetical protein
MSHPEGYRLIGPRAAAIARHLTATFQISPGPELASVLNPEGPACNQSAIRYWTRRQLAEIASNGGIDNLLVALEQRLLTTLQDAFPDAGGDLDIPSDYARRSSLPLPRWERTYGCLPLRGGSEHTRSKFSTPTPTSGFPLSSLPNLPTKE